MRLEDLIQSEEIGVSKLREDIFNLLKSKKSFIVSVDGKRKCFLIPYLDLVDLLEQIESGKIFQGAYNTTLNLPWDHHHWPL